MNGTSPPEEPIYAPNKMGRIVLLSLEEILGHTGLNAVLNLARLHHLVNNLPPNNLDLGFRLTDLGLLHATLEDLYGPRAGRGLATRAGRASFKYSLREFGPVLGISDLAFRLLPLNLKIKHGADVFAGTLNRYTHQMVSLEEERDLFRVRIARCPLCWGRTTSSPCCHLAVGIIQEGLFWVSGGKNFQVEEVECMAVGASECVIHAGRHPLD